MAQPPTLPHTVGQALLFVGAKHLVGEDATNTQTVDPVLTPTVYTTDANATSTLWQT